MNRQDREQLDRMEVLLQRLDSAVVVRDPGSARAAEAFDGLRKSVIQASKSHRVHVAHLIALDESIRSGGTLDLVRLRVAEYLRELGIQRLETAEHLEAFDVVGDSDGDVEVLEAAIVEHVDDGRISVLKVGKAKRTARPTPPTDEIQTSTSSEVASESQVATPNRRLDSQDPVRSRSRFLSIAIGAAVVAILIFAARSCLSSDQTPQPLNGGSTTTTVAGDN